MRKEDKDKIYLATQEQRRRAMEMALTSHDGVNIKRFAEVFSKATRTIRRDLAYFESKGYVLEEVRDTVWSRKQFFFHRVVKEPRRPVYGDHTEGCELWSLVELQLFPPPERAKAAVKRMAEKVKRNAKPLDPETVL